MKTLLLIFFLLLSVSGEARDRSTTAIRHFMKLHPCPSTGKTTGACPGWTMDHIKPRACGGPDIPENMQWQTKTEALAKDKWERIGCHK